MSLQTSYLQYPSHSGLRLEMKISLSPKTITSLNAVPGRPETTSAVQ